MKKISIITINYNNIHGLEKTVESVISQTFKDYEYIIIDGGSNDGALEYLKSLNTIIDYWVSEPDKGIYNAMNKGIKKATGDYLLFLNSGDCLNGKDALNDFISHADFKGDIIYGDYKYEIGSVKFSKKLTPFFFYMRTLPHQSTLIKKELFKIMGNYDECLKISSDFSFFIKCYFTNMFHFQYIPIELTLFDQTGISNNVKYNELMLSERDSIIKEHFGVYYEDYVLMNKQRIEILYFEQHTFLGFLKRVKRKLGI